MKYVCAKFFCCFFNALGCVNIIYTCEKRERERERGREVLIMKLIQLFFKESYIINCLIEVVVLIVC